MGIIRLISRDDTPFADRREAGRRLAVELMALAGDRPVVLGIPRGGLAVAREIAAAMDAALDIVLSRKLRAPGNPELALGALAENGEVYLNRALIEQLNISPAYIAEEKEIQAADIAQRRRLIRAILPRVPLAGRTVIITDDGVATGATLQAALWAVRAEAPRHTIVALPVGPEETLMRLSADCDSLVCLKAPADFTAVGQFYRRFDQVEDAEVRQILEQARQRPA